MKIKHTVQVFVIIALSIGVVACTPQRAVYVSASEPGGQRRGQEDVLDKQMEDAWDAVVQESRSPSGQTTSNQSVVIGAREGVEIIQPEEESLPQDLEGLDAHLWGTPPEAGEGDGVALVDPVLRKHLADALERAPQGGIARWQWRGLRFMFLPNSDVYYAQHSGGRCRDGVFVVYRRSEQMRRRGLFCQKAPGASWFLIN